MYRGFMAKFNRTYLEIPDDRENITYIHVWS